MKLLVALFALLTMVAMFRRVALLSDEVWGRVYSAPTFWIGVVGGGVSILAFFFITSLKA